jgi:hypothetical protein
LPRRAEKRTKEGRVLLPASFAKGNETMQSSLKTELTTPEARDVFAITEKEILVLRMHLDAINNQIRGLEAFMDSMGFTSWIGNNSPRSIANAEFKVKIDD